MREERGLVIVSLEMFTGQFQQPLSQMIAALFPCPGFSGFGHPRQLRNMVRCKVAQAIMGHWQR